MVPVRRVATVLTALLLAVPAAGQDPATEGSISAVVDVLEVGVPVAFPGLDRRDLRDLSAADIVVTEGGILRPTTRLAPFSGGPGGDERWNVLVYFDAALSRPGVVRTAALSLGEMASRLTALGPVDVFVAGPPGFRTQEPTGSTARLEQALVSVAEQEHGGGALAALRRELGEDPTPDLARRILEQEVRLVRERADMLIAESASRCPFTPCLLLLVSDGFWTDLRPAYPAAVLEDLEGPDPAEVSAEIGRVLTALGWTIVAVPVDGKARARLEQQREGAGTDVEAYKRDTGGVVMAPSGRPGVELRMERLEALVEPRYAAVRDWAAQSGGSVVAPGRSLEEALRELGQRWWVFFRSERSLTAGIQSLDVRFDPGGDFETERESAESVGLRPPDPRLRAPRWLRSSVPEEVSRARARRLAERDWLAPSFQVVANWRQPGQESFEVAWSRDDGEQLVRLTLLDDRGVIGQRLVEVEAENGGVRLVVEPGQADVLVIEELLSRDWSWVVPESRLP